MVALAGCAAHRHERLGMRLLERGELDGAAKELGEAHRLSPGDIGIEVKWNRTRIQAATVHAQSGREAMIRKEWERALSEFNQALAFDSLNTIALDGVREIETINGDIESGSLDRPMKDSGTAAPDGIAATTDPSKESISFAFEKTDLGEILRAIAQVAGLNILLDDSPGISRLVTVNLNRVTVQQALADLALTYGLLIVPIGSSELLITQDTQENRERFARDEVRLFMLQYAEAGKLKKMLEPLMRTSVVLADDHLNALVIRTDSSQMQMASQLIASMDARESEVLIQMEILEISRSNLQRIGLDLGDNPQVRAAMGGAVRSQGFGGALTLDDINRLDQNQLFITFPSLYLNLLKNDADTRILAQPQLRILNRNAAKFHVGEKIPLKITTSRYRDTSEETSVYEYRDVGILLEITPNVLSRDELSMDVKIEISSIVKESDAGQPTIGTREIKTMLRLRHGETELIAGLLKNEERSGTTKIPLLGEIPLIGKLFSTASNDRNQTDIVISLTPLVLDRGQREPLEKVVWTDHLGQRPATHFPTVVAETGVTEKSVSGATDVQKPVPQLPSSLNGNTNSDETAASVPIVRFDPSDIQLKQGMKKIVSVRIDDAQNVAGTPFYIEYNSAVLEVALVREGRFMSSDGQATSFLHTIDNEKGVVIIGLSRLGAKGISGSGTLVEIEFVAMGKGQSELLFTHQSIRDTQANELPAEFRDGTVIVN